MKPFQKFIWLLAVCLLTTVFGCTTLREVAALKRVSFRIDRVTDLHLADISLDGVRSFKDLGVMKVARLGTAIASAEMPLAFVLHVRAENPSDNTVPARLTGMEWTLFLKGKQTISGTVAQSIVMPPGKSQDVPISVELNLMDFFHDGVKDLVDLALAVGGQGSVPKDLRLQVRPTIETSLGPIRYPEPITVIGGKADRDDR